MKNEFLAGEADAYHDRNATSPVYTDYQIEDDYVWKFVKKSINDIGLLLDVGCAFGKRTAAFAKALKAEAVGVDPSKKSIDQLDSCVLGVRATADIFNIGLQFDLVLVNFCLHWVERKDLLATMANIDRHVADGGHLLISDFQPASGDRESVPYAHNEAVRTWKDDYLQMFQATGLYRLVEAQSVGYDKLELGGAGAYIGLLQKTYTGETK